MFNSKTFRTTRSSIAEDNIFSGPVDGSKKLPSIRRCKKYLSEDTFLVGYPTKKGCFSFQETNEAEVHLCFYTEAAPNELTQGDVWDCHVEMVPNIPGWGFQAINLLKAYMR